MYPVGARQGHTITDTLLFIAVEKSPAASLAVFPEHMGGVGENRSASQTMKHLTLGLAYGV